MSAPAAGPSNIATITIPTWTTTAVVVMAMDRAAKAGIALRPL